MANLRDLAQNMRRLAGRVGEIGNERKRFFARTFINDVVRRTPVDTSQALSNWRVAVGATAVLPHIGPIYPGELGSSANASASEAIARAEAQINLARPGQALLLFNSVPYIRRLNEGSSAQAPAGFIEQSLLVARKALQRHKTPEILNGR